MNDSTIATLGNEYHAWLRAHPDAGELFGDAIEDLLSDAAVTYDRVATRIKSWPSLKAKARTLDEEGLPAYPEPWSSIHDIIGVRVTVFHSTEIPVAVEVLGDSFIVHRSVDKTAETRIAGDFGYGSHHLVLEVGDYAAENLNLADFPGFRFEVQVRTVLQHAWAEFEHDIRYKSGDGELDPRVDRAFTLAAGLIELADQQFDQIAALKGVHENPDDDVELTAETLPGILTVLLGNRFPRSRSEHYKWLQELLVANDVTTVAQLRGLLDPADIDTVHEAMRYRYQPGQVRLIDDLLLRRFGRDHIRKTSETGNRSAQRRSRLKQRLKALRELKATKDGK